MAIMLKTDRVLRFNTASPTTAGSTTTLSAAITTTSQTAISLTAACGPNGTYIQCVNGGDTERMLVVSGGGTTSPTVERAAWGTTAYTFTTSGTVVTLPGHNTFTLLEIRLVGNQQVVGSKLTSDINYVSVIAGGSDMFPGGSTSLILADNTASLGTFNLLAPGNSGAGATWIQLTGAGAPGAAGAPTTPVALNLTWNGPSGLVGVGYSGSFSAAGGVPPYTFTISSGSLPSGLSLTGNVISGTPSAAGSTTFVGKVTDGVSTTATCSVTLVINGPPTAPYALLLTDTGTRTLDTNGTTYATLQVIIQEAIAGNLSTNLYISYSGGSSPSGGSVNGWTALPVGPGVSLNGIVTPDRVDEDGTHTYYQTTVQFKVFQVAEYIQIAAYGSNAYTQGSMASATLSNILSLSAISAPSATGATLTVTSLGGFTPTVGNIFYNQNGAGNAYWALNLSLATPGSAGDPNCSWYVIWIEWQDGSGNPINPGGVANTYGWQNNATRDNTGNTYAWTLFGNYPGAGVDGYMKISVWGQNHLFTASVAPFTGDSNSVLQTNANPGAFHIGPPPTGNSANMLLNPSFNQGLVGWIPQAGTCSATTATLGGVTVNVGQIVAVAGGGELIQTFSVPAGANQSYYFEIWAAAPALSLGTGTVEMRLVGLNAAGSPVQNVAITNLNGLTSTLQPFSCSGTITNSSVVTLWATFDCYGVTSATLICTNCVLTPAVGGVLTQSGVNPALNVNSTLVSVSGVTGLNNDNSGNLLNDPSFENLNIGAPWIGTAGSVTTSTAYSGLASWELPVSTDANISQRVPAIAGQSYNLQAYITSDSGTAWTTILAYHALNSSGGFIGSLVGVASVVSSHASWQQLYGGTTGPMPAGTAALLFVVYVSSGTGSGNVYIDSCMVTPQLVVGSGVTVTNGAVVLNYGAALKDDGTGKATLNLAPAFSIVSSQLATMAASGLTQGTAVAGTYTFYYSSSGPAVEVGAAGATFVDNYTSPGNTVAVSSGGISIENLGITNRVSVTSGGVGVYGPSGSLTATSGGVVITNSGTSITVTSSEITMVGASGATMYLTSTYAEFVAGSYSTSISSTGITMTYSGGAQVNLGSAALNLYSVAGNTSYPYVSISSGGSLTISSGGSYYMIVTASEILLENGSSYMQLSSTGLVISSGSSSVTVSSSSVAIVQGTLTCSGTSGTTKTVTIDPIAGFLSPVKVASSDGNYSVIDPDGGFLAHGSGLTRGQLLYSGLQFNGNQVVTTRQTGPGYPSGFSDATALAWCQNLYNALAAASGHGLIN